MHDSLSIAKFVPADKEFRRPLVGARTLWPPQLDQRGVGYTVGR